MRRNACLLFLIVSVLLIQSVSAISSDMKDSYLPGETIMVKISGNILEPIGAANVEFRRNHVLVPFDYDLKKLGDGYYLWALAPETQINYSLSIKDISTYVSGKVQKVDYLKNFSVGGNLSDYSVKPGFVLTDSDFEIKVQFNEDLDKTIGVKLVEERDITLKPGENIIKFSISEINKTGLYNLTIGKYNLPAYLKLNETTSKIVTNITIGNMTNVSLVDVDTADLSEEDVNALEVERAKHYCYEFSSGSRPCTADEVCSGKLITSKEGPSACCVNGACVARSAESSGSWAWLGYLLALAVIITGIVLWVRYKKIKAEKNPLEKKVLSLEKKTP